MCSNGGMRNARRAACASWLAALFACPAAATAASVVVETDCDKYGCRDSLVYSAARGERNDVTVVQDGDLVTVRDTARIQPGGACEALDAFGARCALQSVNRFARFELRDQADALDARALAISSRVDGGAGDDRLAGPDAIGSQFVGDMGDDELTGGASPDRFESNRRDGSDMIAGGGPPPVDADAYPGGDEIFYGRSRSVSVRLDGRPNDGGRGEHDNLLSIEGVWTGAGEDVVVGSTADEFMYGGPGSDLLRGGGGADRLVGGDRLSPRRDIPFGSPDRLEGGAGPDVLDAQGGRDLLIGGSGRDQLDGGRGPDRIRSRDPDRDWVLCGRGLDRLAASAADVLARGCEQQHGAVSTAEGIVNWRYGLGVVSLIVACPVAAAQGCQGTLTLSLTGRPQLTSTYSIRPGMAGDVSLPLHSTDLDEAARQQNGAVASTPGDSARFGELPTWPSDSFLDALGIPHL
jgi:hypothetical protein